jgi:hypothetical protein
MPRLHLAAAVGLSLVLSGCDWMIDVDPEPDIIYLIPEKFSGWMCVDFDVKSAPALPREGKALVVRPRPGQIIETADPHDSVWHGEVWIEAGSERRRMPAAVRPGEVSSGEVMSATGPNEPFQRVCRFVGTIDQRDAAGNPPGLDYGWFKTRPVPASERAALVALFEATEGHNWTHKVGWLGPPGTECNWHGVDCDSKFSEETTNVTSIDLFQNNLRGVVPEAFGDLPHLTSLGVYGNELAGTLPASLIRRWLSGDLELTAIDGSLLTDIGEVDLEYVPTFSLCARRRIVLRPEGKASMYQERCRSLLSFDWRPYCEIKQGWFYNQDFGRLAHTIEQSSYFSLKPTYSRSVTHSAFEITRVTRNGKTHQVSDYASSGPQELWTVRQAITGLADSVHWEDTRTMPACPAAGGL